MNEQSNFITLMVGYPIQRLNDVTNEKEWIKGEPFLVTINLNHIVSISTMKGTNQTCIVMQHSDGDGDNVVYYTDIEQK